MLANLHAYAHTLDDPVRFDALPADFAPVPATAHAGHSNCLRIVPLAPVPSRFRVSALAEPDPQLRTLFRPSDGAESEAARRTGGRAPSPPPMQSTQESNKRTGGTHGPLPASTALAQIIDLVASQTPTGLFEWNNAALRFQWRPPPAKRQRLNAAAHPHEAQHIAGLSEDTTLATSRPFLKVATLLRRSATVLDALHSGGELPREGHALVYALRQILDWLRRQLIEWQNRHEEQLASISSHQGRENAEESSQLSGTIDSNTRALLVLSEAAHGLGTSELILAAVSDVLNCPFQRQPPFRPLPGVNLTPSVNRKTGKLDDTSNPGLLLSHIYAHANATFSTSSSPLVRGVMAWVLEHTTQGWREDVSKWIGWPKGDRSVNASVSASRPPVALHMAPGETKAVHEPWCGAQVEQERDERGELDTGYVLRPARIPSFIPLSTARQLLEAGRALHLLHTATDGLHPLFSLPANSSHARRYAAPSPAVPTWRFEAKGKMEQMRALETTLIANKNAAARWTYHGKRRRVVEAGTIAGSASGRPSLYAAGPSQGAPPFHPVNRYSSFGAAATSTAGQSFTSNARPRHSSLRAFPTRNQDAVPPLPTNASQKVQQARQADNVPHHSGATSGDPAAEDEDIESRLGVAMRQFDALPGLGRSSQEEKDQLDANVKEAHPTSMSLLAYLAAFCQAAAKEQNSNERISYFVRNPAGAEDDDAQGQTRLPVSRPHEDTSETFAVDLDAATRQTLLQPWLAWSRAVNAALVSVFFRDLAVDLYLATCQRFLLLGSEPFRARLVGVLFDDGSEGRGAVDEDRFRGRAGKVRQTGGIGLSVRLTSSKTWPPAGSELSVSLNVAVAETLAESKASHARLMASSRPLLSVSSLYAAEAALHDLDQRLSFSVIDMEAEKPKSIHALDWLTLTFTPPPLISPLLQAHASACYQRLFNFLLRILRVQTVLRGLAKGAHIQSRSTHRPVKSAAAAPPSVAGLLFAHDPLLRASLASFRFEAQHFVGALATYVGEYAIGTQWHRFQKRLRQLARGAGAGVGGGRAGQGTAGGATVAGDSPGRPDEDDDGSSVWTRGGEHPDEEDRGGALAADEEDDDDEDEEEDGPARNEETFQLYNVFSLSRYHERVLDRMLQACFLKQRYRGIMKIINDLFQLILDLGQLLDDIESDSSPASQPQAAQPSDDAKVATGPQDEGPAGAYPARERFYTLHARWKSRYALLAQTLRLVYLHSRTIPTAGAAGSGREGKTPFELALAAALDLDTSGVAALSTSPHLHKAAAAATGRAGHDHAPPPPPPPAAAELEMRRLEAEEELDLRALEDAESTGRDGASTAGVLLTLLGLGL